MLISLRRVAVAVVLGGCLVGSFGMTLSLAQSPRTGARQSSGIPNRAPNPELLRQYDELQAKRQKDGLPPEVNRECQAILEDAYGIRRTDFANPDEWFAAIQLAEQRHKQRLTAYRPVLAIKGPTAKEDIYVYEQTPENKAKRLLHKNREMATEIEGLRRYFGTWNPELAEELRRATEMGEQGGEILRQELNTLENRARSKRQITTAKLIDLKNRLRSGRISLEEYIIELQKY